MNEETTQHIDEEITALEESMNNSYFWDNKIKAQEVIKKIKELKDTQDGVSTLDRGNATLSLLAGAGGDDSEDFAYMLYHMYEKFCERKNWSITRIHDNQNTQGGFRNVTVEIVGKNVYGTLKNESGVHRLVRISPFNAQSKRHTSFALVEILPVIIDTGSVTISENDIRIETSKASGPGGQNVNKRETAVRIVHIPTNVSVHVSSERSQEHNKQKAFDLLRAKLYTRQEEERKAKADGRSIAKNTEIEWGNQIRSYVLHPYKMIKDHRSGVETSNIEAVLEKGEIDMFLE